MGNLRSAAALLTLAVLTTCSPPECLPPPTAPAEPPSCPPQKGPFYSIALDHYGPEPTKPEPITMPHVITPPQHEPLKILPHPPIPAPKLVAHRIIHYKTYVKPQVYQRIITVPKVFRFLKKGIHPIIEHIPYQAKPLLPEIESSAPLIGFNSLLKQSEAPVDTPKPDLQCPPSPCDFPQFVC